MVIPYPDRECVTGSGQVHSRECTSVRSEGLLQAFFSAHLRALPDACGGTRRYTLANKGAWPRMHDQGHPCLKSTCPPRPVAFCTSLDGEQVLKTNRSRSQRWYHLVC